MQLCITVNISSSFTPVPGDTINTITFDKSSLEFRFLVEFQVEDDEDEDENKTNKRRR